ncbi:nitrogen fixation protein FixH [Tardiphaga alba]|uniref:Nitrogen fixation protein FixH n=2 Tax=Tardiphaga alba TaxID=340268 RepID=A0ABX8AJN1_9BRAD|nr:nitrogen fixation protein FixH [Tardiphaga alba]
MSNANVTAGQATKRPITGRFVLICLIVFFGMIIGVNVVMMKFALQTLPGTEVDSPYAASLAYGNEIEAARVQAARGWNVSGHVARDADGAASVRVEARDRDGAALSDVVFTGRLDRPADRRLDQPVELTAVGNGVHRGRVAQLAAGQWDLLLEGTRNGERVFLSRNRVILK